MISVIIPVLNEAPRLPGLLAALAAEAEPHEVLVVDGGSDDDSAGIARRSGTARVLAAARGRGPQLAAGAAAARGAVLLFLHADSRFPRGGLAAVARALERAPAAPGGNFRLLFDGDDPFSRWLEGFYAAIRARGFYYGDSGIFVRRTVLAALGGIRPLALMEDYDLARRLERAGPTLCIGEPPLVTSSRRFHGRTRAAIVAGWLRIHALHHLRLSDRLLARLYDSERRGEAPAPLGRGARP
ncbi:MAG: TIGR04283 family arsenosugar biosynthesis glycosyltransferase [Hyphomicrobiales bacterium]|nr:TIGR04283 family arsenosugar biosynthesis glycosyltransferase [Hyphomicrobiales bacterium]MCP5370671.1 TIGR04283 family arsenosugar biosynthesis glycosyltransferase [Hyphomicrobiales bacterium]